ncbi:MAG: helix-turn-helix domain-containing protein [Haloarculaceae archaeon]
MRYLRARVSPDMEMVPEVFRLLAASEYVETARAVATKFAGPAAASALFHVDGDREALKQRLDGQSEVEVAETAPAAGGGFYLLLVLDPSSIPLMREMMEVLSWQELVVVPPVVYRDATVHARLIGTTGTVSGLVEVLPESVHVEAVGEPGLDVDPEPAALSDRQRQAVEAALSLGYYDRPRAATHEDLAEALGCAASTASEHLRKAEAKLVKGAMR